MPSDSRSISHAAASSTSSSSPGAPSTTNPQPAAIHRPAHMTHHAALVASAACTAKSAQIGVPMNVAVVDASLYLLHFNRLPGAKLTSVDIAINKAFTAAGHRIPTSNYGSKVPVLPGGAAYGLSTAGANGGRFTYVGGGIPIVVEGEVVGAVGCSTGTPAQDEEVAKAGVDAVLEYYQKGSGKAKL